MLRVGIGPSFSVINAALKEKKSERVSQLSKIVTEVSEEPEQMGPHNKIELE